MPSKSGPLQEIIYLLETATDPVRIQALTECVEILKKSRRYGYRSASATNQRKSDRNKRVNREFIDASYHRHSRYTDDELAVIADLSLNAVQVAVKLGRTPKGVGHQRRKMRNAKKEQSESE